MFFLGMVCQDSSLEEIMSEEDLSNRLSSLMSTPSNMESAANQIFDNLLEDILLGIAFQEHHLSKLGSIPVMKEEEVQSFAIVESTETDIFGQANIKKAQECSCPSCNRPLSASRFAPHLEKCLGMGRNSSRIASRRIANNCKENAYGGMSDDDDEDWVVGQDKTKLSKKIDGKKKKDKNGGRKNKVQKGISEKNGLGKVEEFTANIKSDSHESNA